MRTDVTTEVAESKSINVIGYSNVYFHGVSITPTYGKENKEKTKDKSPQEVANMGIPVQGYNLAFEGSTYGNSNPKMNNIPARISIWISKQESSNKDNTKVQLIDSFGNTMWCEREACNSLINSENKIYADKDKAIYSDFIGKGSIALRGESDVVSFLNAVFNIPSSSISRMYNKPMTNSMSYIDKNDFLKLASGNIDDLKKTFCKGEINDAENFSDIVKTYPKAVVGFYLEESDNYVNQRVFTNAGNIVSVSSKDRARKYAYNNGLKNYKKFSNPLLSIEDEQKYFLSEELREFNPTPMTNSNEKEEESSVNWD